MLLLIASGSCSQDEDMRMPVPDDQSDISDPGLSLALKKAEKMRNLLDKSETRSGMLEIKAIEKLNSGQTRSEESPVDVYVVNYKDDKGFALLSSDTRTSMIYGISTSGSLSFRDTVDNPGLRMYLEEIMPSLIKYELSQNAKNERSDFQTRGSGIQQLVSYKDPMLYGNVGKWHQGDPYNSLCPVGDYQGKRYLVGCSALAIAQVMSYYMYPTGYNGHPYPWVEMIKMDKDDNYNPAMPFLAQLLADLGDENNLKMEYGYSGSTGREKYYKQTFKNYRYNVLDSAAMNISIATLNMDNDHPVLATGHSVRGGQHAFLIDGYTTSRGSAGLTTYLHCVWGYGGSSNGYYLFNYQNSRIEPAGYDFLDKFDDPSINQTPLPAFERLKMYIVLPDRTNN